eukprot:GHVS01100030.1.p1 GENE.GHVS01100030.1~~GHVS01100030.1.p1  ORF type:complete len:273 (+),score=41.52 GHVS01100030.1:422-1240(+)
MNFDGNISYALSGENTVNINWAKKSAVPVWHVPPPNDAPLDGVARGSWCSLKLRGVDLPEEAVVGFILEKNCFVTVVFDAHITDGELVVGKGAASYMICVEEAATETMDIRDEKSALERMANKTGDEHCKVLLKKTHQERFDLFNSSITNDPKFMVAFNFLLPYGFADLVALAKQVNIIDDLSDRLKAHVDDHKVACQLLASINEVREKQKIAGLRRFEWITTKAYDAMKEFAEGHYRDEVYLMCIDVEVQTTAAVRQSQFMEAMENMKNSN